MTAAQAGAAWCAALRPRAHRRQEWRGCVKLVRTAWVLSAHALGGDVTLRPLGQRTQLRRGWVEKAGTVGRSALTRVKAAT